MRDDPTEIADYLIKQHGLDEALSIVDNGTHDANRKEDFYALSVWREVRAILRERTASVN